MMNDIEMKLNEEISRVQTELTLTEPVSDDYQKLVGRLNELIKARNECQRTRSECWEKFLSFGLSVGTAVGTLALSNRWYKWGFEFEKSGALTSTTFRDIRSGKLLKIPFFRK